MKNLITFCVALLIAFHGYSQKVVVIEKSAKTQELFDDCKPFSLLSILKSNLGILGYYDLKGISDERVKELRAKDEAVNLLRFVFPVYSEVPLVAANGEDSLRYNAEGDYYEFVYPSPDTIYGDLSNISTVVLEYKQSKNDLFSEISRISFFKKYDSSKKLELGLSIDGDILHLDALNKIVKVQTDVNSVWTDPKNDESVWSLLRDSALVQYEDQKAKYEKFGTVYNGKHAFIPTKEELYWSGISSRNSNRVMEMSYEDSFNSFCEDYNHVEELPFSPLFNLRAEKEQFLDKFCAKMDTCFYILEEFNEPLIDEDPDSPRYGLEKISYDEEGKVLYWYEPSESHFFWVDYTEPETFLTIDYKYDSVTNRTTSQMERIYFTKQMDGITFLISYADINEHPHLISLMPEFKTEKVEEYDWAQIILNSDKCRNRYKLNKKKHLARLIEKFSSISFVDGTILAD